MRLHLYSTGVVSGIALYSRHQSRLARWGIALGTLVTYVLVFHLLYPYFREVTAALALLPVAVIAAGSGTRSGVLAGILSFPLNTLLLNLAQPRSEPLWVVFRSGGGPGSVAIVLIGFILGLIHDQRLQLAQELIRRRQVEAKLRESEQHHRALLEAAQRKDRERGLLDQVRQALAREMEMPVIFQTVVEGIAGTFGYTQVSLYLIENEVLFLQHQVGYDQVIERIPLTEGVTSQVVRSQKPILLEDVQSHPAFLGAIEGITSEVCVPLFDQGAVVGVLNVESTHGVRLGEADLRLMIALGEQINIALGRARLYAEVRKSEERFKLMAWATKDAVWDWDLLANQIWWGEGLQKVFQHAPGAGKTNSDWWVAHIHPDDRDKVNQSIQQALESGMEFWSKEYRFQRRDETYADIMDRGYIIRDKNGMPYRMIGAMLDITERKSMESTLLEANDQLKQFLNELQGRNRDIALLNELSHLLQACQSEAEAYAIIAELSIQLFPQTAGAIYLLDSEYSRAGAVATWGELLSSTRTFATGDCLALRRGKTHLLHEAHAQSHCKHLTEPLPAVSHCLPLQRQGQILGILHVQAQHEANLNEAKYQLAYTVVEQSMLALSNLKLREALREQSIRDPLTGLFNRRYMEETLRREVQRVARQQNSLSVIMVDVDHFKQFNDTHGHAAGDLILHGIGEFLQRHIRGEDIACRYGGEEFLLIMPNTPAQVAWQRADNLRRNTKKYSLTDTNPAHAEVTLSLGIATYPEHGDTVEEVLHAADHALYRAKQAGRNCVVIAGHDSKTSTSS